MSAAKNILIVDDEPNVRLVFRTALAVPEYMVATAEDGETALRFLANSPVDLVLLDLLMPGMSGMEVLQQLRDKGNEVPVVIVTAHGSIPDAVAAMRLGAIDFVSKPLSPEALRSIVAEVVDRNRAVEPGPSTPRTLISPAAQFTDDLRLAKRSLNRREFDDADGYLRRALAIYPQSAEANNLMGVLHESRNEHDASYRSYRAALKADRHYLPAKNNMQRYYERFTFGKSDVPVDLGID
jgi:DNA-binding response OmpR family regulator